MPWENCDPYVINFFGNFGPLYLFDFLFNLFDILSIFPWNSSSLMISLSALKILFIFFLLICFQWYEDMVIHILFAYFTNLSIHFWLKIFHLSLKKIKNESLIADLICKFMSKYDIIFWKLNVDNLKIRQFFCFRSFIFFLKITYCSYCVLLKHNESFE